MYGHAAPPSTSRSSSRHSSNDVLSKSLGDIRGLHFAHVAGSTSDIVSIDHRGYLLKRSNAPFRSVATLSEMGGDETHNDYDYLTVAVNTNQPQHLEETTKQIIQVSAQEALTDVTVVPPTKSHPVERVTHALASFFGLPIPDGSTTGTNQVQTSTPKIAHTDKVRSSFGAKSQPIAVAPSKRQNRSSLHHLDSTPSPGKLSPPADVVDPTDGHIWRAKYCVLWEGFLYFYRNAVQGESPEAIEERSQQLLNGESVTTESQYMGPADLSKSPLPRKYLTVGNLKALDPDHANDDNVIWEKRVALDRVSSVRSAEIEYGKYAFELIGDDGDQLILRASNGDELNEWLFQFHRSVASFVKSFVDAMGRYPKKAHDNNHTSKVIDIPPAWGKVVHPIIHPSANDVALITRYQKTYYADTLSVNAYGRSGLNRRRIGQLKEAVALKNNINPEPVKLAEDLATKQTFVSIQDSNNENVGKAVGTLSGLENAQEPGPVNEKPPVAVAAAVPKYQPPFRRKANMNGSAMKENGIDKSLVMESVVASISIDGCVRGGCSDPRVINGSIVDAMYKKRKSSRVGKVRVEAYGSYGGGRSNDNGTSLRWEVGAVSECGTRDSNEDSYLVCSDARKAFGAFENYGEHDQWGKHEPGIFGIFDGHCGNEAARFVTERFTEYFYTEWKQESNIGPSCITDAIQKALHRLDTDFCRLCVEDGRDWDSGSTAIVVAVVDEKLIVSNVGDCRAVVCRSAASLSDRHVEDSLRKDGWTQLKVEDNFKEQWIIATSNSDSGADHYTLRDFYWKEVAEVHTPARPDEKERIENANGWITVEKDAQYSQMKRLDFFDEDVVEILQRCFSERDNSSQSSDGAQQKKFSAAPKLEIIQRLCGDLSVSRALGDRDFKAEFNMPENQNQNGKSFPDAIWWDSPLHLPFPDGHSRKFKGDLVSSVAETRVLKVRHENLIDEFLVIACDGLWDVLDPDEAIRVTRGLLFEKKWSAEKTGARLAELAIHLGSSDNITVIVVRFFRGARKQ